MESERTDRPLDYHHERTGYTCPECGETVVTDDGDFYVWCINKNCSVYAVLFEYDWKDT